MSSSSSGGSGGTTVEVVFPYAATDIDQISLRVGERIFVVHKHKTGWWIGRDERGHVGAFPASYTQPAKEKPKFIVPMEHKTAMLTHSSGASGSTTLSSSSAAMPGTTTTAMTPATKDRQLRALLGIEDDNTVDDPLDRVTTAQQAMRNGSMIDRVIALRKEIHLMEGDVDKLGQKEGQLRCLQALEAAEKETATREVDEVKHAIAVRSAALADLEQQAEVLNCALDGRPLPDYRGTRCASESQPNNSNYGAASAPMLASFDSQMVQAASARSISPPAAAAAALTSPVAREPSEDDLNADPVARKIIKKLAKRLAEARSTAEDYKKQKGKLERRIAKQRAQLEEVEATLRTYTDEKRDDSHSAENGETDEHEWDEDGSGSAALYELLSEEEKQAIDKCQMRVVKYEEKASKFKEQHAAENAEAEALQQEIGKCKKRLTRGDEAAEQLGTQLTAMRKEIAQLEGPMATAVQEAKDVQEMLVLARTRVESAQAEAAKATAEVKKQRDALLQRLAKEQARIAAFEAELLRLQAAQVSTPTSQK